MCHASTYRNWYGTDNNIGNYLQCDILCNTSIAYGSTKVGFKLELQVLSMSLCEGIELVQIQ